MGIIVLYIVSKRKVFFVQIKRYLALDKVSRTEADDQMFKWFIEFPSGNIVTPKLVGLSVLGTNFCVYEFTTVATNSCLLALSSISQFLIDTAPKAWWNYDILHPTGDEKLWKSSR